ncbi:MAG: phosphatase PAP2 family protein [Gammaproteobacteria bacterium]|nr:phosphatase PAP2 family protein [Gammaproteobacteria bacterium]
MTAPPTDAVAMATARWRLWRLRVIAGCWLAAAALLGSWFWPVTRSVWDHIDTYAFNILHGHLRYMGAGWHWFWAAANTRWFDLGSALAFALIFLFHLKAGGLMDLTRRLAQGVFLTVFTVTVLYLSTKHVFVFERLSPSLQLQPVIRLSTVFTEIKVKDISGNSFPGDHGTTVTLFTFFIWAFAGRRLGLITVLVAGFLVLPRMVSGAHWLTDLLVGSAAIALVALPLALATPLSATVIALLDGILQRFSQPLLDWLRLKRNDEGHAP